MHRAQKKPRQTQVIRFLTYSFLVVLTVITSVVLLYLAQGYRFDRSSGRLVKNGLLLVDNKPEAGVIYIDGELKDGSSPGRFVLPAGSYELSLERDGYRGWKKQLTVPALGVKTVDYPRLVPTELTKTAFANLGAATVLGHSPERKWLIYLTSADQQLHLLELKQKPDKKVAYVLPPSIARENAQIGSLQLTDWSEDNKHVIIRQTLPSGTVHYYAHTLESADGFIALSAAYPEASITNPRFSRHDSNHIYSLENSTLYRYRLSQPERKIIMNELMSYQPVYDDQILFSKLSRDGSNAEVGIFKDDVQTIIHREKFTGDMLLAAARFDDNDYLALASAFSGTVTVYRNPLKKPVLPAQLPFTIMSIDRPQRLTFSDNGEFLMAQNGGNIATFDFRYINQNKFSIEGTMMNESSPDWLDNQRLTYQRDSGEVYWVEYDGTNPQAFLVSQSGLGSFFSRDLLDMYTLTGTAQGVLVERVSLR